MTSDILAGQMESRIFKGVLVNFGPGANVLGIKHPSDYSAIHIACSMPHRNAGDLATYMFHFFGEPVGLSRIHIISDPDACPAIAHVQVEDPIFAARIKRNFDGYVKRVLKNKFAINKVAVEMKYEAAVTSPHVPAIRRHLLKDHHARLKMRENLAAVNECAVCLTEAEAPYLTACGHLYCRACLDSQCHSLIKDDFPIGCLGDAGNCSRIFLLPELKLILLDKAFSHLLDTSFTTYIQTTDAIQACPSSLCNGTYRPSADGSVISCFKCNIPICTTCQAPSHSGMTCATYQRAGEAVFEKWAVGGMDVKKCPGCRNLIEKTGGCERVDCRWCGAGFCWRCEEVWDERGRCECLRGAGGVRGEKGEKVEALREKGVISGGEGR